MQDRVVRFGMCARRYGGGDGVTFLDPAGLQRR
jgi:hypothetical protein